jgi:hypothetical protein
MQPILIDRSQLILERLVQKFDDFCIAFHCRFLSDVCTSINALIDGREVGKWQKSYLFSGRYC